MDLKQTAESNNNSIITKLFFRLLPAQILLVGIPALNGIISSLFASNLLGNDVMSAIGMYAPVTSFLGAVGGMLMSGSVILCGKYMGGNQMERTQQIFSLDITVVTLISLIVMVLFFITGTFDLAGFLNSDPAVRAVFNRYLLGCAVGILPMMMSTQLTAFLSLELQGSRSSAATGLFVLTNLLLTWLFVGIFHMQAFGLALASSFGYWVFLLAELSYYFSGKSLLKLKLTGLRLPDLSEIAVTGFPGATSSLYLTVRRLVLNSLLLAYAGTAGMSAFQASDALLAIFWSIPLGMVAVGRMLMSVSWGEEDRTTLKDVIRIMLTKCLAIQIAVTAVLILLAVPFTKLYFQDITDPVYNMALLTFRLIPITMPFGLICQVVLNYGQVSGKQILVHSLSIIDGMLCPCLFYLLLIPAVGIAGACWAVIINGIVTVVYPLLFSAVVNHGMPKTMDQLLMLPDSFGAPDEDRLDISLRNNQDVVTVAEQVQTFCRQKGLDERRSYLSGLFLEEMASNIVEHGFTEDRKEHSVDVRVVYKEGDVILRLKDDCVPFNPQEIAELADSSDVTKNVGIRMVYSMAEDIRYQNILGLNVLTIRIA